jgi:CHAD domain-containing protein
MAYILAADETVDAGVRRCAAEELDRAVSELRERAGSDPVKAVHSARKAIKRERSLLRLVRGSMPRDQRRRENRALRDASRELSGARDAEAMLETLNGLAGRYVGQVPERTFEVVREEFERRRDGARERLLESAGAGASAGSGAAAGAVGGPAVDELDAARGRVAGWELRRDGWGAVEAGVRRSYRDGRRAFAAARADRSMAVWHEWRKRAKDLWYQQRLLRDVAGPVVAGHAKDAHLLADLLGDVHDLGVLRAALTERLHAPVDSDAVVELLDHRRGQLEEEALAIGARVYAERPKVFVRRVRRMWKAGSSHAAAVAAEGTFEVREPEAVAVT